MKFCEECGAKLDDDSTFCEECGAQVATVTSATVENLPKQKTENETNVKVIQEVMGHKNFSTTMDIYAEVNGETTRQSMDNLAKNLNVF